MRHIISWLNIPGYKGETWNPIIGCNKISEGCKNCYAEKMAFRLMHMPHTSYYQFVLDNNGEEDPGKFKNLAKWNGKTHLVKEALSKPSSWKKPRAIFVCSMGDLFHESIPFEWIDAVFSIMSDCDQHLYLLLTKRPERILEFFTWKILNSGTNWRPKKNILFGVTAENQEQANKRIPLLLKVPAAKRFVSIEPMLGPVDLTSFYDGSSQWNYLEGSLFCAGQNEPTQTNKLDWVIVGGESGYKARPMNPNWVNSILWYCGVYGTPFFFKQWGEFMPFIDFYHNLEKIAKEHPKTHIDKRVKFNDGMRMIKIGRKATGRKIAGKEFNEFPEL